MREAGCDLEKLVEFRRDIHQNAEPAFQEKRTHAKIKERLLSYGVDESQIVIMAGTGLVVDIIGSGESKEEQKIKCIALRADMDALPIPENNPDLPYKTVTQSAHMCGHDGHMATLLAAA